MIMVSRNQITNSRALGCGATLLVCFLLAGCSQWEEVASIENEHVRVTARSKVTSAVTNFAVEIEVQNLIKGLPLWSRTVIWVQDMNWCRLAFLDDGTVAAKVHFRYNARDAEDFLFRPGTVSRRTFRLYNDYRRPEEQRVSADSSKSFTLVGDREPSPPNTFRVSLKRRDWQEPMALYILGADSVLVDMLSDEAFQISVWWKGETKEVRYCGDIKPIDEGEAFFAVVCEKPQKSGGGR